MKNTLSRLAAALSIAASLLAPLGAQAADAYPSKPITLIVPWNAGGAVDLVGRKVSDLMNRNGGVNVLIENIAGASSLIGLANALTGLNDRNASCATLDKLRREFPAARGPVRETAATLRARNGCS